MNLKADVGRSGRPPPRMPTEQVRSVANAAADDLDAAARTTKGFIDRLTSALEAASDRIRGLRRRHCEVQDRNSAERGATCGSFRVKVFGSKQKPTPLSVER